MRRVASCRARNFFSSLDTLLMNFTFVGTCLLSGRESLWNDVEFSSSGPTSSDGTFFILAVVGLEEGSAQLS